MLIFGRSPNLLLALLASIFNMLVAFEVGGFRPTIEQIAQVNVFMFSFVAFVANSDSITSAAGLAARTRMRRKGVDVTTRADDEDPT